MSAVATVSSRLEVQPLPGALGADIVGADLRSLSQDDVDRLQQALNNHLVLRFRGTDLTDPEFSQFGARFGDILPSPSYTRSRPVYIPEAPLVTVISNIVEDGVPVGEHGDGELNWHTDLAFTDTPSALTMLLARETPKAAGATSFANMYRAYDALPADLRARLAALKLKHQASHNAQGGRRPGYKHLTVDDVREMPGPIHPIVRRHPHTGKAALYLGRRFGAYVPGLTLAESEALLDAVWSNATLPENTWSQDWNVGDLVIWDNRCTMHRREAFPGAGRRRMHRLTTLGERPIGMASDPVEY